MGGKGEVQATVTWEREVQCDQLLHGSERYSAANCYMGPLLHGLERCSAANCYMGGRGAVRPTVTWEGEVQCDQLLHGRERLSLTNCYMGGRG